MSKLREKKLKPNTALDSGQVRQFLLPDGKTRITQITTFCPDVIGPGPTNLYLIDGDALILVDTGIPTSLAKAFFFEWRNQPMPPDVRNLPADHSEQEFVEGLKVAGYSARDIDVLVISHGHLDHFLMGDSILSMGNPRVAAHVLDTPEICNPWGLIHMWISRHKALPATGMPGTAKVRNRAMEFLGEKSVTESLRFSLKVDVPIIKDGPLNLDDSPIKGVHTRHLPGHSPGSIGLLVGGEGEEKVLLCGDVLLYPITPHPDDLLVYLQTLNRLATVDDVGLVLPAHGKAIHNLTSRVRVLQHHHEQRLKRTFEACQKPRCVWDIAAMPKYFDTYVDPEKFNYLAAREALLHMELLSMVDALHRTDVNNYVHYFQNSGEPFENAYGRIMELVQDDSVTAIMRY